MKESLHMLISCRRPHYLSFVFIFFPVPTSLSPSHWVSAGRIKLQSLGTARPGHAAGGLWGLLAMLLRPAGVARRRSHGAARRP